VRLSLKRAFADGTVAVDMDPLSLRCGAAHRIELRWGRLDQPLSKKLADEARLVTDDRRRQTTSSRRRKDRLVRRSTSRGAGIG
jgi:hypothetical protein